MLRCELGFDYDELEKLLGDRRGHPVELCVFIPFQQRMMVNLLHPSKYFPYRTKDEMVLHAIHRHVKWLAHLLVDAGLGMLRKESYLQEIAITLGHIGSIIRILKVFRADDELRRFVLKVRTFLEPMRKEGGTELFLKEFDKEWGHLFKFKREFASLRPSTFARDE